MSKIDFNNVDLIGKKIKLDFKAGNIHNKLIHIISIVDNNYIVYKYWSKRTQSWKYDIESTYYFKMLEEDGYLTLKK